MSLESRGKNYSEAFKGYQVVEEPLGNGSQGRTMVFELMHIDTPKNRSALKIVSLIEENRKWEDLSEGQRLAYKDALRKRKEEAKTEVELMIDLRGNTNIVDYLDHRFVDWEDELGFGCDLLIRMELLTDLRSQIKGKGDLPEKRFSEYEIRKIGKDICTALELCGSQGIIHRDIKPENIFVNSNGDYKLGDFGIARILDVGVGASTSVGTLQYAAPEQLRPNYDHRVDIYSLGLVLYELSNGNRLPFADSGYVSDAAVKQRLAGQPLEKPQGVSEQLANVILKACAFCLEDRFQSVREFRVALEGRRYNPKPYNTEENQTQPIDKSPVPGPGPKPPAPGHQNTVLIAILVALAVVALLLAFVLGGLLGGQKKEEPPQVTATQQKAVDSPATSAPETIAATEPPATEPPATSAPENPVTYVTRPLSDCIVIEDSNEEGKDTDAAAGSWKDWWGNIHTRSVRFWVANKRYYSNTEYIVYDIGGQYETLSCQAVAEEGSEPDAEMVIRIYLDGWRAWESPTIFYGSGAEGVTLDVRGVQQVYVECTTDSDCFGYCILDAELTGIQP